MRTAITVLLLAGALLAQDINQTKTIVGRVWLGRAAGVQVQVNLETAYGTTIATTYTDGNGQYTFAGLHGGVYLVSAAPEGFIPVTARANLGETGDEAEVPLFLHARAAISRPPVNPLSSPSLQKKALTEYKKGRLLLDQKKYAQAIEPLTEAVAAAPLSAMAYTDLGSAYFGARKLPEARRSWQQALRIDAHYTPAAVNLARLRNDKKDWKGALKLLNGASSQLTGITWPFFLERGRAEYGMGQWAASSRDLDQALMAGGGPKWPQIYALRANLYVRSGQYPQARRDFELYLQYDPKGPLAPRARNIVKDMIAHGIPEPAGTATP